MLADAPGQPHRHRHRIAQPCATGSASCPTLLEPALNKPTTRAALLLTLAWDPELLGHDAELRRGTPRTISINQIGEALLSAKPPIRSLLVVNGNPAAVAQNQGKLIQGLLRDDLFTVVHEIFPTDTVQYADVVLPATMQLEQMDLHLSYWSLHLRLYQPAVPALVSLPARSKNTPSVAASEPNAALMRAARP